MAIERNITIDDKWFTGTDKRLKFRIYAADNATPEDVSTWDMSWMVKKNRRAADADALITKSTTAMVPDLEVVGTYNADPLVNTQYVTCLVSDVDLVVLKATPNLYYHELKRTEHPEEILTYGSLQLLQAVHVD